MEACGINFFYLRAVFPLTLMFATASAQVCVPLGHSSLYFYCIYFFFKLLLCFYSLLFYYLLCVQFS